MELMDGDMDLSGDPQQEVSRDSPSEKEVIYNPYK